MSKICPNCQAAIGDDDKFCAVCGGKTEPVAEPAVKPEAEAVSEPVTEPLTEPVAEAETTPEPVVTETPAGQPTPEAPSQGALQGAVPYGAHTAPNMPGAVPYSTQPMPNMQGEAVKKSSGKGLLIAIIIIIIALCIGAGLLLYSIFSGGGYKGAVDAYFEYMESYDGDDLAKAVGDDALTYYVEEECESDMDTFYKGCEQVESLMGIADLDVDYKITDSKEMSADDLKEYEVGGYEVSEGYIVETEYTVKGGGLLSSLGESEETEPLTVIKFGDDWCVVNATEIVEDVVEAGQLGDSLFNLGDLDF